MERVKETIQIKTGDNTIDVHHDGIKKHKEWTKESQQQLKEWVQETLEKGETEGWMPFANFEASVEFKTKK